MTPMAMPLNGIQNFPSGLFAILQKNPRNYCLTSKDVTDIRIIFKSFHESGNTEFFFHHVKHFGNDRAKELIVDTVFDWEQYRKFWNNPCAPVESINHQINNP